MLKGSFNRLQASIQTLKGVGPATATKLRARQIETLEDALLFLPTRYQDRSKITPIEDLAPGLEAVVSGEVTRISRGRPGPRRPLIIKLEDGTGELQATWFGLGRVADGLFEKGQTATLVGRVDEHKSKPVMRHPEIVKSLEDPDQFGRFIPVYRQITGVSAKQFRRFVGAIIASETDRLQSPLPPRVLEGRGLLEIGEAFRRVHFPQDEADTLPAGLPRQTLIFTELFLFQAGLAQARTERRRSEARSIEGFTETRQRITAGLDFVLTGAQERVLDELAVDLYPETGPVRPMNRLLQGDVGSGKTIIAAIALLAAASSGRQAALMAPTEILAVQQQRTLAHLAEQLGLEVALLTGSQSSAESGEVRAGLADGSINLVAGTSALIQASVRFKDLGLAIIDEQHRFGVKQRAGLTAKGRAVHLLTMTATPIPRSLALTVYGDLDVSILDEKPPGRRPVITRLLPPVRIERAWQAMVGAVKQGYSVYVILPAVDSEKIGSGVIKRFKKLGKDYPDLRFGLLHGRLDKEAQGAVMAAFAEGELDVLVATTVVEVGLDVPHAALVIIEDAERFGLAQIHQLRGRVGRGGSEAACLLISGAEPESLTRLKVLEGTEDGFEIAENDLQCRGPGELLGARQAGWPDFRLADLISRPKLLVEARQAAFSLIAADPELIQPDHKPLAEILDRRRLRRFTFGRSG